MERIVFLGITGLLFASLFNPANLLGGLGFIFHAVLEPLHLEPTLADEIRNAQYIPDPDARYFEKIVKEGEPFLKYKAPMNVSENVYIALMKGDKIIDDYQISVVDGRAVCYGRTPRTGGNANCGEPTVWVKVDVYAAKRVSETQGFVNRAYLVKGLFLSGHIDVYPKSKAFQYLGQFPEIIEMAKKSRVL